MIKTIITYGTFDMFHIGHLNLLTRLKSFGDRLIVGVSTDEFNVLKGKKVLIPFEQRKKIVAAIREVDLVIPECNWEQKVHDIKKYNVDIFSIGNDWEGKFDYLNEHCKVMYIERTKDISTTQLKQSLQGFFEIQKDFLKAYEVMDLLNNNFK